MPYKLQKFLLKNICRGGVLLLLLFSASYAAETPLELKYVSPEDLIINLNPDIPSGKAYIFWTPPEDGRYTLKYKVDSEEKIALQDVSCKEGEVVRFYITSNSITTETGKKYIFDFQDGKYPFTLTLTTEINNTIYSTTFTITVDGTPPPPPSGFKGTPGDKGVKLEWHISPSVTDIESFILYYSTRPDLIYQIQQSEKINAIKINGALREYFLSGLQNDTTYHFVIRAKDFADNYSDFSSEITLTPRKTYSLADLSGEEGGCFIATASFGGINNPVVIIFRMFRDNILSPFPIGRRIIRFYYSTSPQYAEYIRNHPAVRFLSFLLLSIIALLITPFVLITLNPSLLLPSFLILFSIFKGEQ